MKGGMRLTLEREKVCALSGYRSPTDNSLSCGDLTHAMSAVPAAKAKRTDRLLPGGGHPITLRKLLLRVDHDVFSGDLRALGRRSFAQTSNETPCNIGQPVRWCGGRARTGAECRACGRPTERCRMRGGAMPTSVAHPSFPPRTKTGRNV
jgi:hypothetical protein